MSRSRLPRLAAVLAALLVRGPDREWVVGDLEEGFTRRRTNGSGTAAWGWFLRALAVSTIEGVRGGLRVAVTGAGGMGMVDWMKDLGRTLRGLRRAPSFSVTAVLTLALGIGATVGTFNLVDAIVLRPLEYDPDGRLVRVWGGGNVDYDAFETLSEMRTLDRTVALAVLDFSLVGPSEAERLEGVAVSPGHFDLLTTRPLLGRMLTADDYAVGAQPVVVLSHRLWRRTFGEDPSIIGTEIRLARGPVTRRTVVGVLGPDHRDIGYEAADAWIPLTRAFAEIDFAASDLFVTGRLAPGVDADAASRELAVVAAEIQRRNPRLNGPQSVERANVQGLHGFFVGDTIRSNLVFLMLGVLLVFLVACGNVVNLAVTRASERSNEMAVRAALGGGRASVLRLFMLEAAVIGAFGGLLGAAGAWATQSALLRTLTDLGLPRIEDVGMDARVWLFAGLLVALGSLAIALVTGASAIRRTFSGRLELGDRGSGGARGRFRLNHTLVVVQVALTLPVLAGAGLIARSSLRLAAVDPGFETENVLTLRALRTLDPDVTAQDALLFHEDLGERFASIGGVQTAGLTTCMAMGRCSWWTAYWAEHEDPSSVTRDRGFVRPVSVGYMDTHGIPLEAGRPFTDNDRADSELVTILSRSMADELFAGDDPLGRSVRLSSEGPLRTVIGVAGDVLHRGLDREAQPTAYQPLRQTTNRADNLASMYFVLRTTAAPSTILPEIRRLAREADPTMPLVEVATMDEVVRARLGSRRAIGTFLMVFSALALVLSLTGIYGTAQYALRSRRRETGIRMAVGAEPGRIARHVTRQGMTPVLAGLVIGSIMVPWVNRSLEALVFGAEGFDWPALAAIVGITLACSIAAHMPAAWGAANSSPADVMQAD